MFKFKTNTKLQKRTYNTKKRVQERKTQRLYRQVIGYVAVACAVSILSVWNHYHVEHQNIAKKMIEAINSSVHIEKVKAATADDGVRAVTKTVNPSQEEIKVRIDAVIKQNSFKWPAYLKALINCENKRFKGDTLDLFRTNTKNNHPAHSIDRGLLMINDFHNTGVSSDQAFDLEFSVKFAIDKINAGLQSRWVCDKKVRANRSYYENF